MTIDTIINYMCTLVYIMNGIGIAIIVQYVFYRTSRVDKVKKALRQ